MVEMCWRAVGKLLAEEEVSQRFMREFQVLAEMSAREWESSAGEMPGKASEEWRDVRSSMRVEISWWRCSSRAR
jgi:hypothetical protein